MFKIGNIVHSALYQFGEVTKVDSASNRLEVKWDRLGYGTSSYDLSGRTKRAEPSYPSLQLIPEGIRELSKERIEEVQKWQTKEMDKFFNINQK